MNDTTYNGWKNWETWNCGLWVNNDYAMYNFVLGLVNSKVTEWADVAECLTTYFGAKTPDGVTWTDADEAEMTEMLTEMA